MSEDGAFSEFNEGRITFNPTFKYDPGTDDWDSRFLHTFLLLFAFSISYCLLLFIFYLFIYHFISVIWCCLISCWLVSKFVMLFIARQHTDARYWYSNSVCLFVRLSRSGILWKRLNILS